MSRVCRMWCSDHEVWPLDTSEPGICRTGELSPVAGMSARLTQGVNEPLNAYLDGGPTIELHLTDSRQMRDLAAVLTILADQFDEATSLSADAPIDYDITVIDGEPQAITNAAGVAAMLKDSPLGITEGLKRLKASLSPEGYAAVVKQLNSQ